MAQSDKHKGRLHDSSVSTHAVVWSAVHSLHGRNYALHNPLFEDERSDPPPTNTTTTTIISFVSFQWDFTLTLMLLLCILSFSLFLLNVCLSLPPTPQ